MWRSLNSWLSIVLSRLEKVASPRARVCVCVFCVCIRVQTGLQAFVLNWTCIWIRVVKKFINNLQILIPG